ncbi:hypothetical protein [Streptomyces sp. S.PB5]|uniref:hypothetical protein n=1 Tax=Streptomyces sp. S.PB5 TaxID=3020844 RepID=UPI0025B14FD7|nr:hypothetical protein [Streptomyces sp. S.PB5]MDN3027465.1 hypothetical protein [Streptomyces sp. S.PB5]
MGETVTSGGRPVHLERMGRPEVKNVVLASKGYDLVNSDLEIRDLYNEEDAFAPRPDYAEAYRARFNANLAFFDCLDGELLRPPDDQGTHPLTELLLADFLVVDISKPFAGTAASRSRPRCSPDAPTQPAVAVRPTTTSWTPSTHSWWAASAARASVTASTRPPGRPHTNSRTSWPPTRTRRTS